MAVSTDVWGANDSVDPRSLAVCVVSCGALKRVQDSNPMTVLEALSWVRKENACH